MAKARSFYWRWLRTAFCHSIGPVDLWTGLVGSLVGVADHYIPEAGLMTTYGWQIPIWALAAVMAARLILAPYWMWKEDAKTIQALRAAFQSTKTQAEAATAKAAGYETLIKSAKKLARQILTSEQEYAEWEGGYASWMKEAKEFIKAHEGYRAAGIFRRIPLMAIQPIDNAFNPEHNTKLNILWSKISDLTADYERALDEKHLWHAENT